MKLSLLAFLLAFLLALLLSAAAAQAQRPGPPGMRQADQAEAQHERNIPPPPNPRRTIDFDKLKRDADELAALAQSVPSGIDQTAKGVLPKDLSEKLKRIEKLAKGLRSQITQ